MKWKSTRHVFHVFILLRKSLGVVNICSSSSPSKCKWWGDIDERRGLRSQGHWWRIEQKRPCAARNSSLSSSLLKAIMGGGSLKWVATARSIIFEMLSHKSLGPAYNLVSCFNVIRADSHSEFAWCGILLRQELWEDKQDSADGESSLS